MTPYATVLWFYSVMASLVLGASVYESLVVHPAWSRKPPESFVGFVGVPVSRMNIPAFWMPVTPLYALSGLGALGAALGSGRTWVTRKKLRCRRSSGRSPRATGQWHRGCWRSRPCSHDRPSRWERLAKRRARTISRRSPTTPTLAIRRCTWLLRRTRQASPRSLCREARTSAQETGAAPNRSTTRPMGFRGRMRGIPMLNMPSSNS